MEAYVMNHGRRKWEFNMRYNKEMSIARFMPKISQCSSWYQKVYGTREKMGIRTNGYGIGLGDGPSMCKDDVEAIGNLLAYKGEACCSTLQ